MATIAEPIAMTAPGSWTRLAARVLRLPLLVKLAGANALIVVVAWTTAYVGHSENDWRPLVVLAAALVAGMAAANGSRKP